MKELRWESVEIPLDWTRLHWSTVNSIQFGMEWMNKKEGGGEQKNGGCEKDG